MDIVAHFSTLELPDEARRYLTCHAPRYSHAIGVVRRLLDKTDQKRPRILDIGPHFLTQLLRDRTHGVVDQLGYRFDLATRIRPGEVHHEFDLNDTASRQRWPRIGPYDVIVAGEVLEHLHVSPSYVLRFLFECLSPGGHLVLQTPNAVALKRRLVMLLGRNPFELIREEVDNPGHFREYTRREISDYVRNAGFELVEFESRAYFDYSHNGLRGRLYGTLAPVLPASLRDGMTFVLRRAN